MTALGSVRSSQDSIAASDGANDDVFLYTREKHTECELRYRLKRGTLISAAAYMGTGTAVSAECSWLSPCHAGTVCAYGEGGSDSNSGSDSGTDDNEIFDINNSDWQFASFGSGSGSESMYFKTFDQLGSWSWGGTAWRHWTEEDIGTGSWFYGCGGFSYAIPCTESMSGSCVKGLIPFPEERSGRWSYSSGTWHFYSGDESFNWDWN